MAYALSLRPGALISDTSGEPVLTVLNRGAGDALRVDGNLNVSGDLIGGSHAHNSFRLVARIDPAIARDSEVAAAPPQVRYDVRAGSAASYTITIPHFQLFRLEMASDWPNTYGMASLEGFENDGNTSVVVTRWDGRFGAAATAGPGAVAAASRLCWSTSETRPTATACAARRAAAGNRTPWSSPGQARCP